METCCVCWMRDKRRCCRIASWLGSAKRCAIKRALLVCNEAWGETLVVTLEKLFLLLLFTPFSGAIVAELFLAFALQYRRLWWICCVVGISLHLSFGLLSLLIGWFMWYMLAVYLLVVPNLCARMMRQIVLLLSSAITVTGRALAPNALVCIVYMALVVMLSPVMMVRDGAVIVCCLVTVSITSELLLYGRKTTLRVGLCAMMLVLYSVYHWEALLHYYRFHGGDASRCGRIDEAIASYTSAATVSSSAARWRSLYRLYDKAGMEADAQYCALRAVVEELSPSSSSSSMVKELMPQICKKWTTW